MTLAKDIVFIRAEVTPIGGEGGHEFNGTFDGAGYSIRGYSLTSLADARPSAQRTSHCSADAARSRS